MHKNSKAFTIIELLVVITIIGILTTISVFSFRRVQVSARDTQRSSKTTVITEALEDYYSKYGEYPSCSAMSQAADTIATNTLIGIDSDVLTTPSSDNGANSILPACADLTGSIDAFAYVGDTSAACLTGTGQTSACTQFTLKYREESSGDIISITSRHAAAIENVVASPTAPTITVTLSGSNVLATITPVTCPTGTAQYQIDKRLNDGIWMGYTAWSTTTTATQTTNDGVKYGYRAQARCYVSSTSYSTASTGSESTYVDPITTPSAPVIADPATSDSTTTTWSWNAVSCAAGTTARYQYDYLINSVSQTPSGWKTPTVPTNTTISFTTSTEDQTYTVQVQAQCYNANATSGWSATGAVGYYRIRTPKIANGDSSTCVITSSAQAYCWGYNLSGQLGNNSYTSSPVPVAVTTAGTPMAGKTIKSITTQSLSAGDFTCALASDNQAYCWGGNDFGQLGNNSYAKSPIPVAVSTTNALSGKTIKSISAGYYQACVIASDDNAYCWGQNGTGQLGNNSTTDSPVPVAVSTTNALSGKTIKSISTGSGHTCVIASDNNAYCWGQNSFGQLGNNSITSSPVPVAVTTAGTPMAGKTIKSISTGSYHTCVIASDDNAYCWGYNDAGKLGNNSTTDSPVPVAVTTAGTPMAGKTIQSISTGWGHTCVIASDNNAYCWGYNVYGALGNNSTTNSPVPVAVTTAGTPMAGKTIKSISTGFDHTCVIASDNNAYCWGQNIHGQLGNNSTINSSVPVATVTLPQ